MKPRAALAALVLPALLAARAEAQPISFTTLAASSEKGSPSPGETVMDTDIGYMSFLAMRGFTTSLPDFNYRTETAVAIDLGSKPDAGWSVAVSDVSVIGSRITVSYTVSSPTGAVAHHTTTPWCLVKFPRQPGVGTSIRNIDFVAVQAGATKLPFATLYASETSDLAKPTRAILDTDIGFGGFLAMRGVNPLPAIDLDKDFAVAIAIGEEPTSGFAVHVTDVSMIDSKITVSYSVTKPLPYDPVTKAKTDPFIVVTIPKQEGVPTSLTNIRFQDVTPGASSTPSPFAPEPKLPTVIVKHPDAAAKAAPPASAAQASPSDTPGIDSKIRVP